MFSTTNVPENSDRSLILDGKIYYFKHGWISNKWVTVFAKLWSDSTLEWFESKDSDKPIGSILLSSVIPYFCIGSRIKNIPTQKPKIKASWDRKLLMAIATDIQATVVHWFYFGESDNFRRWISEITETLPRIVSTKSISKQEISDNGDSDYEVPSTNISEDQKNFESPKNSNTNSATLKNDNNFDSLFNEIFKNYGLGEFFFPMTVDTSDYESEIDSDNDEESVNHKNVGYSDIPNLDKNETISTKAAFKLTNFL